MDVSSNALFHTDWLMVIPLDVLRAMFCTRFAAYDCCLRPNRRPICSMCYFSRKAACALSLPYQPVGTLHKTTVQDWTMSTVSFVAKGTR